MCSMLVSINISHQVQYAAMDIPCRTVCIQVNDIIIQYLYKKNEDPPFLYEEYELSNEKWLLFHAWFMGFEYPDIST